MENDFLKFYNWKLQVFRYAEVLDQLKNFTFEVSQKTSEVGWSDGDQEIEIEEISLAELSELECFFV